MSKKHTQRTMGAPPPGPTAADERRRIVAWLRTYPAMMAMMRGPGATVSLHGVADAIERGAHRAPVDIT